MDPTQKEAAFQEKLDEMFDDHVVVVSDMADLMSVLRLQYYRQTGKLVPEKESPMPRPRGRRPKKED